MRCPFLREAQVKSCCASPFKKMIVRTSPPATYERCTSADWMTCPAAKQHQQEQPGIDRCPFLQESLVQYCSAVPTSKYIPYSEASLSRCGGESHSYCEVFLSAAKPDLSGSMAEGHEYAETMFFSTNHMWKNVHEDGTCHVGIDEFLANVLGDIEKLSFVTVKGLCFPTVVLTVRGVDLQLTFPHRIQLKSVNSYLRARLSGMKSHPYTLGWLFEGAEPRTSPGPHRREGIEGLIGGNQARKWMGQESKRLTDFVHNEILSTRTEGLKTMMDGGVVSQDMISHLTREELLRLFHEFFSPATNPEFLPRTRNG